MIRFDVVVVGGGHAGCEAAAAAARLGRRTALVTLDPRQIGRLSCNPAIGGLAKGHLVRELDALGGRMARIADATTIQFRHLNTRKGLAVRSSRAQVDIERYPRAMQADLASMPGLTVLEGEVAALRLRSGCVAGVRLADGTEVVAPAVVLTTGTFLSGVMHCGDRRTDGGRVGDGSAHALARALQDLGVRTLRLKTGTVPRLDGRTIAWDRLTPQHDTVPDGRFSFADIPRTLPQITCHLASTHAGVHELVRGALDRSPLFTGRIEGVGPRYCPSLEDKVVRFPDRDRHLLFLEPEGLDTHRVYVNGLSTSLPADVQEQIVHAIEGLEDAVILQHGYAVEYDVLDPRDLGPDLQRRDLPGLYLAGQVNGTSGYEEAAVQGFLAGVAAARGEPLLLGRDEAYMGVLVDDLVTRGVGGEPYRMFTSRAEHRLLLREDNADRRLMPRGRALGLIDDATWSAFEARQARLARGEAALDRPVTPDAATQARLAAQGWPLLRKPATVRELLRRPEVDWEALATVVDLPPLDPASAEQLTLDVRYDGYLRRAERRAERARRMDTAALPADLDLDAIPGLSHEVRQRLRASRPHTLGQAARLPGVTPAAVQVLTAWLVRAEATPHNRRSTAD